MSDEAAFLDAIRHNPDCDTVRLVMADWLQENGQEERGELIRCQINRPDGREGARSFAGIRPQMVP